MIRILRTAVIFATVAALLSLSGCVSWSSYANPSPGKVTYPQREPSVPQSLRGDRRAEYVYDATLFYISMDYKRLVPIVEEVRVSPEDDALPAKVVARLLQGVDAPGVRPVAPEGTTLLAYEQSQGIATVNVSIDARTLSEQEQLWMFVAITNTLSEFPEITGVNVLTGGQANSVLSLPVGTLVRTWENLATLYTQNVIEQTQFLKTKPSEAPLERSVTLYFASVDGKRIVPELRSVEFQSANLVDGLLRELIKGPAPAAYKRRVLPVQTLGGTLLSQSSDIITTDEGLRIIRVYFNPGILDAMNREGLSVWQLYGALTLTLCRTVPDVDGIAVYIGDARVIRVDAGAGEISFEGRYMTPEDFSPFVGSAVRLYFTGEDGFLTAVDRMMDMKLAFRPRAWIEALIDGPKISDGDVSPVFPEGITEDDVLAVHIDGDAMLINVSSNFYRLCQQLSQQAERNLIYAIVNTLADFPEVKRVRFFVEGEVVESLAGPISLVGPLIKNPGIVH
jgi:spore germination protein GerM